MSNKYVYLFSEGNASMKNLLGGKGANLAEMTSLGIPVPDGFIVTTESCNKYYEDGRKISDEIIGQIYESLSKLEESTGKKFGDNTNPLTSFSKIWCKSFNAGYDGYYLKLRIK